MDIAALITWVVTALGGFYLLGTWLAARTRRPVAAGTAGTMNAGGSSSAAPSRLPAPLVFGHFLLAATGLVLWIVYLATDSHALAWVSFGILVAVALGGFMMFARWLQGRSASSGVPGVGAPEDRFPVVVVAAHGVLAATTLVLVLLAALEVGGS